VTGGRVWAASEPPAAAATAAARAAAAASGTANIVIYSVNTDGARFHAIVSGVIGDYGPAVSIYPDGKVDLSHNSEMELRLTHGSFRLSIAALNNAFVKAATHEPIYPMTCTDLISVTGTTPIVAGSGNGAYHGIRGSFPLTITLSEVEAWPCQPSPGAFRAQLITMAGSGTISFGGIAVGKMSRSGSWVSAAAAGANEHDHAGQTGEVADDVVVAVLGVGQGRTGASLPMVTARRSRDSRYADLALSLVGRHCRSCRPEYGDLRVPVGDLRRDSPIAWLAVCAGARSQ